MVKIEHNIELMVWIELLIKAALDKDSFRPVDELYVNYKGCWV